MRPESSPTALVTVGNLPVQKIADAKDYALAEAARPFLGSFGYLLITLAALLSTLSAINATLYGAARLSYTIAKDGELPAVLERKLWNRPVEGLLITNEPAHIWVLAAMLGLALGIESAYRLWRKGHLSL